MQIESNTFKEICVYIYYINSPPRTLPSTHLLSLPDCPQNPTHRPSATLPPSRPSPLCPVSTIAYVAGHPPSASIWPISSLPGDPTLAHVAGSLCPTVAHVTGSHNKRPCSRRPLSGPHSVSLRVSVSVWPNLLYARVSHCRPAPCCRRVLLSPASLSRPHGRRSLLGKNRFQF